jgi:hypothetical protein
MRLSNEYGTEQAHSLSKVPRDSQLLNYQIETLFIQKSFHALTETGTNIDLLNKKE